MRIARSVMQLGSFDFDTESGMLTRSGESVPLPPKSLATLSILADRLGELVTKNELIARLWPEGFVSDQNLTQHIYNLRRAFADDASIAIADRRCAALSRPAERHYLLAEHFWSARSLADLDYAKREFDEVVTA